ARPPGGPRPHHGRGGRHRARPADPRPAGGAVVRPPAQPRQPRRAPVAERPGEDVVVDRGEDTGPGPRWHPTATTGAAPRVPDRPRGSLDLRERTRRWLPARPQPAEHAPDRPGFLERLAERARAQRRLAWRKVLLA